MHSIFPHPTISETMHEAVHQEHEQQEDEATEEKARKKGGQRLTKLALNTGVKYNPAQAELANLKATLDQSTLSGGVVVALPDGVQRDALISNHNFSDSTWDGDSSKVRTVPSAGRHASVSGNLEPPGVRMYWP